MKSTRMRLMTGLLTTLTFGGVGGLLFLEQRGWIAFFLLALGVFRGVVWLRELYFAVFVREEDDD